MKRFNQLSRPFFCAAFALSFAFSPPVAWARQKARSAVPGASLPKGGERFSNADKHFRGLLADLAKQPGVRRDIKGAVETFLWGGTNYRQDRVAFTKAAVQRALAEAGYDVRPIGDQDIHYLNIFEHFDSNAENLPLQPSLKGRAFWASGWKATARSRSASHPSPLSPKPPPSRCRPRRRGRFWSRITTTP